MRPRADCQPGTQAVNLDVGRNKLRMRKPVGKYNALDKITRSEGRRTERGCAQRD